MDNNHSYIQTENINQIIDSFVNSDKFQENLDQLIINSLSNKKIINLPRAKIAEKIVSSDYIRLFEQDLLENLLSSLEIDKIDKSELIINNKNPQKRHKENFDVNSNLDSIKIFNILIDEFLSCHDLIKLENYFGDLSNFESLIITRHEKIDNILIKLEGFLKEKQKNEEEAFLIPNVLSFINKILKTLNTKNIIDITYIFITYFSFLVEKFFKGIFDISRFYKISLNLECFNNLILGFYNEEIIIRKIDESKINYIIRKLLDILLKNYQPENPIYLEAPKKNAVNEFGISTNYIILLLFNLDKDLSALKVAFRISSIRKHILDNFESIENLPFIDVITTYESFKTKNCFLWKHPAILEQIFPKTKITKKHLIYSWVCIKLHFLGLTIRYKSLKNLFYKTFKEDEFNCFIHFTFLLEFNIELLYESTESSAKEFFGDDFEFESQQKENMFYLIKEILCDFLLYCTDAKCLVKKQSHIITMYNNTEYRENKMFLHLLDDMFLAIRENNNYLYIKNKDVDQILREEIMKNDNDIENDNDDGSGSGSGAGSNRNNDNNKVDLDINKINDININNMDDYIDNDIDNE
jgi:hypothetical protein